ncbi:MAG: hypothetical protein RL722_2001 [Pseudomonadota bacterium]|jgi:hypothetical protein
MTASPPLPPLAAPDAPAADDPASWVQAVTAEDLAGQGIDAWDDETPPQAVNRLAEEMAVDLASVGRCLRLLAYVPCVLAGGAPVGLLAWSPRRGVFRASFDTECHEDQDGLTLARAGLWLTLLSAEVGPLPERPDHWMLLRLDYPGGIGGVNRQLVELAGDYAQAQMSGDTEPADGLARYYQDLGRAIWWCASHRLR